MSLLLLLALSPAPGDSTRYRLELDYSQTSGETSQDARMEGLFTLTEKPQEGVNQVVIRLDSLIISGAQLPAAFQGDPGQLRGVIWQGQVVDGRLSGGLQLNSGLPQAALLTPSLEHLYPGFKASLKVGEQWSDTSSVGGDSTTAQRRTTIVDWNVVSLFDSAAVVHGESRGEMQLQRSTALGERSDRITMQGTRELSGPLTGPMHSVVVASVQQQTSTVGDRASVQITIMTGTRITALQH